MGRLKGSNPKTSVYTGVYFHGKMKRYVAQYKAQGKSYYLGSYEKETDAAHAYDCAKHKLVPQITPFRKPGLYCPGTTFYKERQKFKVSIMVGKDRYFVGSFLNRSDAVAAGLNKVKELIAIYPDNRPLKKALNYYEYAHGTYEAAIDAEIEQALSMPIEEEDLHLFRESPSLGS